MDMEKRQLRTRLAVTEADNETLRAELFYAQEKRRDRDEVLTKVQALLDGEYSTHSTLLRISEVVGKELAERMR